MSWINSYIRSVTVRRIRGRRINARIRAAFENIDLTKHSFVVDGRALSTMGGASSFYSSDEVDKAIAALNKLMQELEA